MQKFSRKEHCNLREPRRAGRFYCTRLFQTIRSSRNTWFRFRDPEAVPRSCSLLPVKGRYRPQPWEGVFRRKLQLTRTVDAVVEKSLPIKANVTRPVEMEETFRKFGEHCHYSSKVPLRAQCGCNSKDQTPRSAQLLMIPLGVGSYSWT